MLTTAQKKEERAAEGDKEAAGHATRLAREELEKALTEQVEHERTAIPETAQKKRTRVPEKRGPGGEWKPRTTLRRNLAERERGRRKEGRKRRGG